MTTSHRRLCRRLAMLAGAAALATIGLALAPAATAATPGAGDWGTSGSGTRLPGTSGTNPMANICLSDSGCDYAPGLTFTDRASNGGSYTSTGARSLVLSNGTTVGTCTVTSATIDCVVTASGHVAENVWIGPGSMSWQVAAGAPSNALIFNPGTHVPADWTGNDPDNDTYPIYTPSAGDWGTANSSTRLPGSSGAGAAVNECLSDGGCDYGPGLTFTDRARNGGSFTPGTTSLTVTGHGTVGTCTITTSAVDCKVTERGHVVKGGGIATGSISWQVAANAPANALVFSPGTHVDSQWVGNDASNDVYPIYTPDEAGAPMIDWGVAGGVGGAALLLGAAVLARRRRRTALTAATL